jgi:hypothetical protein
MRGIRERHELRLIFLDALPILEIDCPDMVFGCMYPAWQPEPEIESTESNTPGSTMKH